MTLWMIFEVLWYSDDDDDDDDDGDDDNIDGVDYFYLMCSHQQYY